MTLRPARDAWLDLAAMTALILSYTWLWKGAFDGHELLCFGLYVALGLSSHRRRGESLGEIGFRLDNFGVALRRALVWVGPWIVAVFAIGTVAGTLRWPPGGVTARGLIWHVVWGTAQQYGLLAFYHRRLGEVLPGAGASIVATAAVFALFHLPNPFLTPVTFLAAMLACWLYRREPNVPALGLAHAALSFALLRALPVEVTFGMRVGPGFLRFCERLGHGG
jgi:membrane protease YdiL (CAAX protease family)